MRRGLGVGILVALALSVASCATGPPLRVATPPPRPVPAAAPATSPTEVTPPAWRPPARAFLDQKWEPYIKVGLAWDLDSLTLTPLRPVQLCMSRADGDLVSTGCLRDGEAVGESFTVRCAGDEVEVVTGAGTDRRVDSWGDTLLVQDPGRTLDEYTDSLVSWNGKRWRGRLEVFRNPRGKLTLVTRLPLETYLIGVVPGEIGALQPDLIEAGRAQAIAARSYTFFYKGRRGSEGFDLYGTVEDQVYGSVETERALATACVQDTRGQVVIHDGQPIRANYCADCGGISAEVWEAWPAPALEYLQSRRDGDARGDFCETSPQHRWRERWRAAEFLANVQRYGPALGLDLPRGGLGELVDVRADARSRSGRVWRLVVQTTTGSLAIPSYAVRGVLRRGGNPNLILRSNLFKIDVRRDPATRRALEVVASGAGAGHGVGLCQIGALGMARRGAKATEILKHYYPHVEVWELY